MKIPASHGRVITVSGDFARSDMCDRDFHKLSESFGMHQERLELRETTDYSLLPVSECHAPNEEFEMNNNTKAVQVHPMDASKTALISTTLNSA